ncbi:hypothetical protein QBC46DRAFT_394631 [Diplogelasinospora grovesii]|uniref:Protein kinase domain-containing protein n=1 Tax=Diplogelasinospora grovesii TaxID=303347 RepID=A0AAN6N3A8_9PEZI|nr:hypothetical protein QBC46DRAFT_394631 [Diplogelasinospora grovesii]
MELASSIFSDVLSPLAAFNTDITGDIAQDCEFGALQADNNDWQTSFLNPQSRIDSLTPHARPRWRLDGADVDGRRFFAVPVFAIGAPPLRIDIYLPASEEYPGALKRVLRPEAVIYAGKRRIHSLPVSQHVLRALENWSLRIADFEQQYMSMPFGSQIFIMNMASGFGLMEVHLCPNYDVEQSMHSIEALQKMWKLPDGGAWPPVLEWSDLGLERQLHEAITLVRIKGTSGLVIFKSLIRDQRYMYNELKMLLTLPPHPHVIPRPAYVVTKKGRFGGRHGVCGFILEYYPLGSLKERLLHSEIALEQRLRWSRQVTEALIHVNHSHPFGFYPDLKPDNIVFKEKTQATGQLDVVLLDLEQRGGWFSWSPPEIAYIEYLEILASTGSSSTEDDSNYNNTLREIREEISARLKRYMPGWTPTAGQQDRYCDSEGGFSGPWRSLLRNRMENQDDGGLERAQVFMLGKLLWCIFEHQPFVRCGIDHELLQDAAPDSGPTFPEFRSTPEPLRSLIRRCTAGAPEWDDPGRRRRIVLRQGKLVPAVITNSTDGMQEDGEDATNGPKVETVTAAGTREAARTWWAVEVERARRFLQDEILDKNGGPVDAAKAGRRDRGDYLSSSSAGGKHHGSSSDEEAFRGGEGGEEIGGGEVEGEGGVGEREGEKRRDGGGGVLDKARMRPTLAQVLDELKRIEEEEVSH